MVPADRGQACSGMTTISRSMKRMKPMNLVKNGQKWGKRMLVVFSSLVLSIFSIFSISMQSHVHVSLGVDAVLR